MVSKFTGDSLIISNAEIFAQESNTKLSKHKNDLIDHRQVNK